VAIDSLILTTNLCWDQLLLLLLLLLLLPLLPLLLLAWAFFSSYHS
jgi:hypothetical protein